jgi:hypothetical protein
VFIPPFDTAVCIALLALALTGDTQRPDPQGLPPQYRGYQEVVANQHLIVDTAQVQNIPAVSLAAGIMNQGSSWMRPFGTDTLDRLQISTGLPSSFPFSDKFGPEASIGIAQLTASEVNEYLPGCSHECALQPGKAIESMAVKIAAAAALLPGDISMTDRLMVLALAQNNGPGAANLYLSNNREWSGIYQAIPDDWDQLGKVLENIRYLTSTGDFILPEGVDLERWEEIFLTYGQSES